MLVAIVRVHVGPYDREWIAAVSQDTILAATSIGLAGVSTRRGTCVSHVP